MKARADDPSGWMVPFELEAREICLRAVTPPGALFTFVQGRQMQAGAIQAEPEVVVMFAGMFWMLCRLASTVAGSGVFPAMIGEAEARWAPDLARSGQTPRALLDEGEPFDWELESAGWKDDPERLMLFHTVLSVLFRFVIFHEIGHLQNDHGRRRTAPTSRPLMMIDDMESKLVAPKDALPSQAREIIADSFALNMTLESLHRELMLKKDLEMTRILREKLLKDEEAIVDFVLTILCMYFRLSDRSDWESQPVDTLSHPPAPFRMKALMAALIEHQHLGISEEATKRSVANAMLSGDAVMSVMLGIFPNPHWFRSIATPEHDQHFMRIFDELPRWSGRLK